MSNYRFDSQAHKTPKPKQQQDEDLFFYFVENNAFTRVYSKLFKIAIKALLWFLGFSALYIVAVIVFS